MGDDFVRDFVSDFFRKKMVRPEASATIEMRGDMIFIRDELADKSRPNLVNEFLVSHLGPSCRPIIWSRVYQNGTTHHELYCACTGFAGMRATSLQKIPEGDLDFVLWFGKHKGQKLSEVPLDYLEWCAANLTDKPGDKIRATLKLRQSASS